MNEALITLQQVLIIFAIIFVGIILAKKGLVDTNGSKQMSNLVVNIVSPAVIFMSFQTDYDPTKVHGLLLTFAMTFFIFLITIPLSSIIIRKKEGRDSAIERMCIVYSNCGFMGIPLVAGIYGYEGVFYVSAVIAVFNIMVWTHGVLLMNDKLSGKEILSLFKSPNIIAIILGLIFYFSEIRIPLIPRETLQHFANMNTPLAMLISAFSMANANFKKIISNARIYIMCAIKLLLFPIISLFALKIFNAPEIVYMTVVVTSACPTAGMSTILALKYDRNNVYASELVAASTLLSVITLPLIVLIA